jgi:hypothetical protein
MNFRRRWTDWRVDQAFDLARTISGEGAPSFAVFEGENDAACSDGVPRAWPQGLKPTIFPRTLTARLKPCPSTKPALAAARTSIPEGGRPRLLTSRALSEGRLRPILRGFLRVGTMQLAVTVFRERGLRG